MRQTTLVLGFLLLNSSAWAFECAGVKVPSNIVVCSDPELIRLADERQQAFNHARWGQDGTDLLDPPHDKELWENQRSWVRSYATACGVPPDGEVPKLPVSETIKDCFRRAAVGRIAFLRAYRDQLRPPAQAREDKIGPSFDCQNASRPLALIICADPELAKTDLFFNQAYWALMQQLDEPSRQDLKQEDADFIEQVQSECGLPSSGALTSEVWNARNCIQNAYEEQRKAWISEASGAAREEATRPIRLHIELERKLRKLALLTTPPVPEGVYGAATRRAIVEWQQSRGKPPTGVLGNSDAFALQQEREPNGAVPKLPEGSPPTPQSPPTPHGPEAIPLEPEHGIYTVPIRINGQMTIHFILDTGAGEVAIPEDVFSTLLRTKTVLETDFIGTGTYILADGSTRQSKRFTLHELKLGNRIITDVVANVIPMKGDALLGQTFLSKLPSWTLDNRRHVLVLEDDTP